MHATEDLDPQLASSHAVTNKAPLEAHMKRQVPLLPGLPFPQ